jgi:hypothetical protein
LSGERNDPRLVVNWKIESGMKVVPDLSRYDTGRSRIRVHRRDLDCVSFRQASVRRRWPEFDSEQSRRQNDYQSYQYEPWFGLGHSRPNH